MFQSATLKLTLWYAAIIVAISLAFSVVIYSIASSEVGSRIGDFQQNVRPNYLLDQPYYNSLRDEQVHEAEASLLVSLVVTNACIWLAGGVGSYYLAKRTLRPIEEAHEAQSRFTSDASHELRTPLASMKIELEVALRDKDLKKEEMHELLESNLEEVNKLTVLSQTLLQLSRLDHDSITREKVHLNDVAEKVIDRFNKLQPRIELMNAQSLNVLSNTSNVEELLTILLDNALKYSPTDSKVKVDFIKQKNLSGFSVTNSGEGIPADILPHIFDRFYRVDTSRTGGDKKGFGLGLALAKKLVQIHGGELTVSSAPNSDTTFNILLPNFSQSTVKNQK
jgi:signal transduction histidine kinase